MVVNNNPYLRDTEYIDPTFYIPEGLEEWQYDPNGDIVEYDDSEDTTDLADEAPADSSLVEPGTASSPVDAPRTPEGFTIISQTVRRQRDGTQVIDVVIEVDDIPGATKYELRVTKA